MKSLGTVFITGLASGIPFLSQAQDGHYPCAVDYYQSKWVTDGLNQAEALFIKIDSAYSAKIKLATGNREKEVILQEVLWDLMKMEWRPDTTTPIGKEFNKLFGKIKPNVSDTNESHLVFNQTVNDLRLNAENDSIAIYRSAFPRLNELTFYGITDRDDIDKVCCVIKKIHLEENTKPIPIKFYEKENLGTINEQHDFVIRGRQEEKTDRSPASGPIICPQRSRHSHSPYRIPIVPFRLFLCPWPTFLWSVLS